jgi:hypothetical protein
LPYKNLVGISGGGYFYGLYFDLAKNTCGTYERREFRSGHGVQGSLVTEAGVGTGKGFTGESPFFYGDLGAGSKYSGSIGPTSVSISEGYGFGVAAGVGVSETTKTTEMGIGDAYMAFSGVGIIITVLSGIEGHLGGAWAY